MPIWIKYLLTAALVVVVSEVARRSGRLGALLAALPLVTILVILWLHLENAGRDRIAEHAWYTFWYVIPTLPGFLLIPWLIDRGLTIPVVLLLYVVTTLLLFVATFFVARLFGIDLML